MTTTYQVINLKSELARLAEAEQAKADGTTSTQKEHRFRLGRASAFKEALQLADVEERFRKEGRAVEVRDFKTIIQEGI